MNICVSGLPFVIGMNVKCIGLLTSSGVMAMYEEERNLDF